MSVKEPSDAAECIEMVICEGIPRGHTLKAGWELDMPCDKPWGLMLESRSDVQHLESR